MDGAKLKEVISQARKEFVAGYQEEAGILFNDDDRVIRFMRMELFQEKNLKQLPTMDQFVSMIDENWIKKNVKKAVKVAAETDWHYKRKFKEQ